MKLSTMHKTAPRNKELSDAKKSLVLKLKKPGLDGKIAAHVLTETLSLWTLPCALVFVT